MRHAISALFSALSLGTLLSGCTVVGPDAIRSGRMAYNEAITETNNQQMLMVMVHNRYEEANHLLTVASVTANVRVSGSAQIEAGFGDADNYDGNLVPFSGGFVYEENPTISYTPVTGEAYLGQIMSPLPLPVVARITRSLPRPEFAYSMLISSVNGIHNPAFLYEGQRDDPRFDRLVALMTGLTQRHCLHWVRRGNDPEASDLLIEARGSCAPAVDELLALLGLSEQGREGTRVQIPVTLSEEAASPGGMTFSTRSIWELVEIMSAAVQVPMADEHSGMVSTLPEPGRPGRRLRIGYAESRPDTAYVAVEHRDSWFYIDQADLESKRYFKLLESLWTAAMAKALGVNANTPVLTVPVSR